LDCGKYYHSYFLMDVNFSNECFRPDDNDALKQSLLHEYIHFLQDFSLYGLLEFNRRHEKLRKVLASKLMREPTIRLPINSSMLDDFDVINEIIREATYSYDNKNRDVRINRSQEIELAKRTFSEINELDDHYDYGNIQYYSVRINDEDYAFCAHDVIESMAYLLEHIIFGDDETRAYNLTSDFCEMLVHKIYPAFGHDKKNIVALCEFALSTYNPGFEFIKALSLLKEELFMPCTAIDVFEKLISTGNFADGETLSQKLGCELLLAQRNATDFYDQSCRTLKCFFDNVATIWQTCCFPITRGLLKISSEEIHTYYCDIIKKIGSPLIFATDRLFSTSSSSDKYPQEIYASCEIEQLLFRGNMSTKTCKLKNKNCMNCHCDEERPLSNPPEHCFISNLWVSRKIPHALE